VLQSHVPALRDLVYLGTGLAAIGIGRNPNGAFGGNTPLQQRRDRKASAASKVALAQTSAPAADKVEVGA
jgi:hypothetical protein